MMHSVVIGNMKIVQREWLDEFELSLSICWSRAKVPRDFHYLIRSDRHNLQRMRQVFFGHQSTLPPPPPTHLFTTSESKSYVIHSRRLDVCYNRHLPVVFYLIT